MIPYTIYIDTMRSECFKEESELLNKFHRNAMAADILLYIPCGAQIPSM